MSLRQDFPQLGTIDDLAKARRRKVYLVGGFLRDLALGKTGSDFDFAVSSHSLDLARSFSRRVKGAYVLLDQERGSARVVKKEGGVDWTYDFTDFRGKGISGDLRRRDFTVNTLCVDLSTGKDYSPRLARKDLKARIIRMVSPKVFLDDPLRLLRAFSLEAQTGFKIDAKTLARIKKEAHLIRAPAMERIREEIFKILHTPRAFKTITALDRVGLLTRVLPQLCVMHGIKQGGFHHLDVWKHSLEVLSQLEQLLPEFEKDPAIKGYFDEEIGGGHTRISLIKLAALLHDVGKPETRKKEGARMTFHGHEHAGKAITRQAAKRLKLSVKERYWLENAVRMHLRPGYLSNFKRPTAKAMFRYMRDTKSEAAAIAILAMGDQRATRGPLTTAAKAKHHERICRMMIEEYFTVKAKPVLPRLLTGHDLIKTLKLKPSPMFAEILTAVQEAQALKTITTRAQALALAQDLATKNHAL